MVSEVEESSSRKGLLELGVFTSALPFRLPKETLKLEKPKPPMQILSVCVTSAAEALMVISSRPVTIMCGVRLRVIVKSPCDEPALAEEGLVAAVALMEATVRQAVIKLRRAIVFIGKNSRDREIFVVDCFGGIAIRESSFCFVIASSGTLHATATIIPIL